MCSRVWFKREKGERGRFLEVLFCSRVLFFRRKRHLRVLLTFQNISLTLFYGSTKFKGFWWNYNRIYYLISLKCCNTIFTYHFNKRSILTLKWDVCVLSEKKFQNKTKWEFEDKKYFLKNKVWDTFLKMKRNIFFEKKKLRENFGEDKFFYRKISGRENIFEKRIFLNFIKYIIF